MELSGGNNNYGCYVGLSLIGLSLLSQMVLDTGPANYYTCDLDQCYHAHLSLAINSNSQQVLVSACSRSESCVHVH